MLRLRQQHVDAFSEVTARSFEDRMVRHLNKFFAERCEALGEGGVRDAIRHGIRRAADYDIRTERNVCKYIDLMFAFGRDYDTDAELPWAGLILNDPAIQGPTERIDRLYDRAIEHARRLAREG